MHTPAALPAGLVGLKAQQLWGHLRPAQTQPDPSHNLAAYPQLCTDGGMSRRRRVGKDRAYQGFDALARPVVGEDHGSSLLARLISAWSTTTSAPVQRTASWETATSGACQVNHRHRQPLQ
jgi:hypothetical protein